MLDANQLECDEAVLTGESIPASKTTQATTTDSPVDLPACAFMGTVVHQGSGRAVVVATGSTTAFGKIAVGLAERQADTAFQAGLRGFSRLLVRVAGVLTVSIFVINVAFSRPLLDALLFSLAIAITFLDAYLATDVGGVATAQRLGRGSSASRSGTRMRASLRQRRMTTAVVRMTAAAHAGALRAANFAPLTCSWPSTKTFVRFDPGRRSEAASS